MSFDIETRPYVKLHRPFFFAEAWLPAMTAE